MSPTFRRTLLYGVLALCLVGVGMILANWSRNQQVTRLKEVADSMATIAALRDTASQHFADSTKLVIDSLQRSKIPRTVILESDSAAEADADKALAKAQTARDSIVALQKSNQGLRQDKIQLLANAHTDSISLAAAIWRGDSIQLVERAQAKTIKDLNNQIQALNAHALPKWARIGFTVLQVGLALKGAGDVIAGK